MAKFVQVAFKKDMIKVNEGGADVWYDTDKAVKGFAGKAFQAGDEIELTKELRNGKNFVTRVSKPGQGSGYQGGQSSQSQSAPAASSSAAPDNGGQRQGGYHGGKSPEESEKITRLSVMSTAGNIVSQGLCGQFQDPNTIGDVVISVYNKLLAEVKKGL
jgi:hypothetical protein